MNRVTTLYLLAHLDDNTGMAYTLVSATQLDEILQGIEAYEPRIEFPVVITDRFGTAVTVQGWDVALTGMRVSVNRPVGEPIFVSFCLPGMPSLITVSAQVAALGRVRFLDLTKPERDEIATYLYYRTSAAA